LPYDPDVVKRLAAVVLLLVLAGAGVFGVAAYHRDREYRELLDEGDAALAAGDTFQAIEAFSGAVALKGDSMVGYLKRGDTYRRRRELDAAHRDLRRATELDPLAPRAFELLGDVLYEMSRFDRAAERYERSVALDDRSPRVLYKLALARYRRGNLVGAQRALGQSVAIDDRFAEAYYLLGLCARDLQAPRQALAALEKAVLLDPALLQAREELANLYGRLGRSGDRITQLEALRALDSTPSREIALGLAYARAGRTESAVSALGYAAERYPEHTYTFVALGRVWLDVAQARGDRVALRKALGALEGAVGTDQSSEALTLFGRALLLAGDVAAAERMLIEATERRPVEPEAFFILADIAERRGKPYAARAALVAYQALEGDDPDVRRRVSLASRIATHSTRLDDHVAAVAWLQRAIDASGPDLSLLVRLADAQSRAGDPAGARETLQRVLARDPQHPAARAILRRVR
jgi:tetratricopeptide (TPR) repeat protein